jgi:hypothetical protein
MFIVSHPFLGPEITDAAVDFEHKLTLTFSGINSNKLEGIFLLSSNRV